MSATQTATVPYPKALAAFPSLRQSTLSAFDLCGLSAKFDMTYRSGWNGHPQGRGQLFHRFAAEALRTMHRQGEQEIEVDVALTILDEVIRQQDADVACPLCGGLRIRKGVRKDGKRMCLECRGHFESQVLNVPIGAEKDTRWIVIKWAFDNAFDIQQLAGVELYLEAEVAYPNPLTAGMVARKITGHLDALLLPDPYEATVIDWKDTWDVPGPTEMSFEGYFQQRFYALLVFANFPTVEKVTTREFYVRHSETREATLLREDFDMLVAEIGALAERFDRAFERKVYRPSPGKHCLVCVAPQRCPIFPEVREEGAIRNPEEAVEVARQLIVTEGVKKQLGKRLRAWSSMHGDVPVRDAKGQRMYGYRHAETTLRPEVEDIDQLARELGRSPTPEEIKGLYKTRTGTRFGTYAPSKNGNGKAETNEEMVEAFHKTLDEERKKRRSPAR